MKKINVLQLITGLGIGGAEKVVYDISINIDKDKFNNYVVSLSKQNDMLKEFIDSGISVISLNKKKSLVDLFCMFIRLVKFVYEKDIDVIHAHMSHSIIVATLLKITKPKIKIITTSHSLKMESLCREIFLYIFKFLRFKDILFSKRMVRFFYIKDYEILPNGIDISRYSINKKKNNRFTFISIGRLEEVKNHKDIIRIAHEMKDRFDFELQIVGDGTLRCELQKLIDELGLNDNVKLLGFRKDIPLLLNQAHCFLLPSLWEGMPIVLLEAAASCLPIISTPVGGIKDFLDDTNATLSSIADFKQEMIKMINNYDAYLVKANKLYLKVKNEYSIKAIVERHERIYLEAFQKTESITCAG